MKDPVTGTELTFLTSTPGGDSKIYQRICGYTPPEMGAGGDMALDGDDF